MPETGKKGVLTLVRMGNDPKVLRWLMSPTFRARVACGISRYVAAPPEGADEDALSHHFVGGKWTGIFDFFRAHPDVIDRYDYFWFPDDDIETTPENALKFLDIVQKEKFTLAQPSLAPDSYYAHRLLLQNPRFQFRRTNLVELMMPVMHRTVLKRLLPLFEGRHAALGLDYFWHQLTDEPARDVAVIDAVAMGHYRPRQVLLKNNMSAMQIDIMAERERTFSEFSIHRQSPVMLSGRTVDGVDLRRGPRLWYEYFRGLSAIRELTRGPRFTRRDAVMTFIHQIESRPFVPCMDADALGRYGIEIIARSSDGH